MQAAERQHQEAMAVAKASSPSWRRDITIAAISAVFGAVGTYLVTRIP
jgi:hypothetical protein